MHNGLTDKRPALIARCRTVPDVVDAIRIGREQAAEISVRSGGHGVAGLAVTDGGLMIDLAPMKGIKVDPRSRTVWAQGGVTWKELYRAAAGHGLATTGGVVSRAGTVPAPSTGIGCFTRCWSSITSKRHRPELGDSWSGPLAGRARGSPPGAGTRTAGG